MNIAVNCRLLQKGKLEGIGWFMFETLKRLTRDHPEHRFYFIFDRAYHSDFQFSDNVTPLVVGPPTRHPVLWYLWFEWRIPAVLKRIKADLFYSPDGYLSLRTNIPQVTVIHDINFAHRPKDLPFLTRKYYNYFFPKFARKAQRICTVSEYSKEDIHVTYAIDKPLIHVVYNGANENYTPLIETDKNTGRDKYAHGAEYFIFIGSIHPRKNLENLIEAYNRFVKSSGSKTRLLVVGTKMWALSGQKAKGKSQMAKGKSQMAKGKGQEAKGKGQEAKGMGQKAEIKNLENEERIIFAGRLEAEELRIALGAAKALTFIPWFEGFGIPVLEAMYAGVPVLTSTETSLPEVGGNAVLYANPGNIEQISEKLLQLDTDADLRKMLIDRGFEQKQKFSWELTAGKVWNCINTVINAIEKNQDA